MVLGAFVRALAGRGCIVGHPSIKLPVFAYFRRSALWDFSDASVAPVRPKEPSSANEVYGACRLIRC